MIIISDTSVVTNLTAVQQLELLPQLYDRVIFPAYGEQPTPHSPQQLYQKLKPRSPFPNFPA